MLRPDLKTGLSSPLVLAALLVFACVGCSDDGTNPQGGVFAGRWTGTTNLDGQAYATTLALQQSGDTVNGNIEMSPLFPPNVVTLTGTVNASGDLDWTATYAAACRTMTGTLTFSGGELDGPVDLDQQSCQDTSPSSGTMVVAP